MSGSVDEQAIRAIMNATDCTRIRAETAYNQLGYVPDAIEKVRRDLERIEDQRQAAHATTLGAAFERIDDLEFQVRELKEELSSARGELFDLSRDVASLTPRLSRLDGEEQ